MSRRVGGRFFEAESVLQGFGYGGYYGVRRGFPFGAFGIGRSLRFVCERKQVAFEGEEFRGRRNEDDFGLRKTSRCFFRERTFGKRSNPRGERLGGRGILGDFRREKRRNRSLPSQRSRTAHEYAEDFDFGLRKSASFVAFCAFDSADGI